MIKLCFFVDDITKVGGIERVTATLANVISSDTCEVTIVSIFHGRPKANYEILNNVKIEYITDRAHGTKPHSIERIKNLFRSIPAIRRYFKSHQFNIIVAQSFPPALALFLCGEIKAKRIVAEHVHALYYNKPIQIIRSFIYKKFDKVVVLTSRDKSIFDKYLDYNHTVVIPNPVKLADSYNSPLNTKSIISVGRLEYQKGFDTLIKCFKEIHQEYPDWCLNIFGEGSLKSDLNLLINNLNLCDNVFLKGHSNDIKKEMRKSAFYVMTSHFEGFPMVLIEAMNQGLPCISFDCPSGPSDIIKGDNGILVEDQNLMKISEAIKMLIEDKELRIRYGRQAKESVDIYDEKHIAKKWIDLFLLINLQN